MKLKFKSTLFSLLICGGIAFSSCSEKDDLIEGPDPKNPIEEGDSYLSLKMFSGLDIMFPTKATEDGDDAENTVAEVLWVLYDDTDKVAYSEVLDAETNGTPGSEFTGSDVANSTDRASFTMKAKKVKAQDYRLLVVLNPTAEMKTATTVGSYLAAFDAAKTTTVADVSADAQDCIRKNIVMSNANGLVDVKKDTHMYETAEEAEEGNKPLVQVDRILAKVTFQMKPKTDMIYPNGGELVDAIWKLDITNKKTYWMRRKSNYAPIVGNPGNPASTNWTFENGTQTDRSYFYAEDPNWDNFSLLRKGTTGNLEEEFNYADLSTAQELSILPTREYTLENTMNAAEQWEDVTTRVLIRGNYIPEPYKQNNENVVFNQGDSYYFFGGSALTFGQIKNWLADMVNDNKNYPWPTAPAGVKEAVVNANNAGFFDFSEQDGRDESGSHEKLHFYKDGVSYYSALIRHFDDNLSLGYLNFGRYGVVRNNVYKMTLTKITGPGKPNIPDPEGPDDKEEEYLSTDIEVLPWVIRTQNIEL